MVLVGQFSLHLHDFFTHPINIKISKLHFSKKIKYRKHNVFLLMSEEGVWVEGGCCDGGCYGGGSGLW